MLCGMNDPAKPFAVVQKRVAELFEGRTVVGHALSNDFSVRDIFDALCWVAFGIIDGGIFRRCCSHILGT
jgi:hypothetical protein